MRPLVAEDPRGATLNLLFLPLVVVCLPAAALLAGLGLSTPRLLGAIALFAALGGLAVVGFIAGVLDTMPGSYLELSAVAALVILAIALPVTAFVRLLGHGGLALGALLFVLVGNPASGNGTAPELLPEPWRAIGQLMPSGAGGSALRNVAYFDGNAVLQPLLVPRGLRHGRRPCSRSALTSWRAAGPARASTIRPPRSAAAPLPA